MNSPEPQDRPKIGRVRPLPLHAGAKVAVVAPSGPADPAAFEQGLAILSARYRIQAPGELAARARGFLAGSDSERRRELQDALDDPDVSAIWIARGGYGLGRILPELSWTQFAARPRWLVGFSDATVLHAHVAGLGFSSLHAANVTGLARLSEEDREQTFAALEGRPIAPLRAHFVGAPFALPGPVFGGNLTVLFSEAASGRLVVPSGCSLLLEDVGETSYRIDRMLTALIQGGHLDSVSAFLLGEFTDCSPGKFQVETRDVLFERLRALGKPIAFGLPVGHGAQNAPVVLGGQQDLREEPFRPS